MKITINEIVLKICMFMSYDSEAWPGYRLSDLYSSHIHYDLPILRSAKTIKNRISQLDGILNNSLLDDTTVCIATDGSVSKDNQFQEIGAISAIYLGERKTEVIPCGTCSSTDAELAALHLRLEMLPQAPEI